jgi:hypothetical protein
MRVQSVGGDARRGQGRGVRDTRMAAPLVNECRPSARHAVELRAVGLTALGQLVGPVAHALLPVARLQLAAVRLQPLEDVVNAVGACQIRCETGEPVVDDVRVRVVEPRERGRSLEVDDSGSGAAQVHDFATAAGDDDPAGDRQVAVGLEARPAEGADPAAGQDQIRLHFSPHRVGGFAATWREPLMMAVRLVGYWQLTCAPTPSPCPARRCARRW